MAHYILKSLFHILLFLTPLFWLPITSELFEFNKMMLVYLLTTLITTAWIYKMIQKKELIIKRTPLDIPILVFLASQILSTIFSIDPHLSIFGYYSRQNGGLLSIISYILVFYAYVANFNKDETIKFLKTTILGGVTVSLWAIPEHFGASPSCLLLTGNLDSHCWVQDVQARVFATLGQPNWLATYLAILIFPCIYFVLTSIKRSLIVLYSLFCILIYTAFTFTYSRGATLGLIIGLVVFVSLWLVQNRSAILNSVKDMNHILRFTQNDVFRRLSLTLLVLFSINILFGSAVTSFSLLDSSFATRESLTSAFVTQEGLVFRHGTQLDTGGTESGIIRLIVWRGALDVFKHYPLFGSGVETFAYSYYKFRPVEHNLISEWDFLYNKAHNEYLNYLATTGAVGFISYFSIIVGFTIWALKQLLNRSHYSLFIIHASLLAAYTSYLISNFFGFSVVITALLFFLIPAFSFTLIPESLRPIPAHFAQAFRKKVRGFIFATAVETTVVKIILVLISSVLLYNLWRFWTADTLYNKASNQIDKGDVGSAYNNLIRATNLNPYEPLYLSDLSFAAANSAVALTEDEATTSAQMKEIATDITQKLLTDHPNNVSLFRNAIRTYYTLSVVDPEFTQKTLEVIDQTINLAPTDPKLYYNKALVLDSTGDKDGIKQLLDKALELKPNYKEAQDFKESVK